MRRSIGANILIQGLFLIGSLQAHGVQYHIWRGGIGVEVHHEVLLEDGGETPLANADVQIFGPGHGEHPFQTGKTDIHGIFMFRPDTIGTWTLKFLDDNGHGKVVDVEVDELNSLEMAPDYEHGGSWRDAITGVGILLFGFCLWYMFKKKP